MLFPSARVHREIYSSDAGVWYLPTPEQVTAIAIKAPSTTINATISGCGLELLFGRIVGRSDAPFCTGVRIHDTIGRPLSFLCFQNDAEQYLAMVNLLHMLEGTAYLFNELDMCVAWGSCTMDGRAANQTLKFVGDPKGLVPGNNTEQFQSAMNEYEESIGEADREGIYGSRQEQVVLPVTLSNWEFSTNYFIGARERAQFSIGSQEEGAALETAAWFSLDSVFPGQLFKNPVVKSDGGDERELTDVLAIYPYGHFLIEAKALTEKGDGFRRSPARKLATAQKHARKAIKQLVGAAKSTTLGRAIYSDSGHEIVFDRAKTPHCIVLLAELQHEGDWEDIVLLMGEGMEETGGFFHVLDLQELLILLKGSRGHPELLDYNLIERAKHFVEMRSIHIRTTVSPGHS